MYIPARLVVICLSSSALLWCLTACSSSSATKYYAVADYENNRVLIYDTPISTDESASVVLGQADFTHGASLTPPYAANTITGPRTVAADSSGNLYVGGFLDCRVLQFKPPFTNHMDASVVFGGPDFTTGCGNSASTFAGINAIAIDGGGDLWVADSSARIVEFVPPFRNGMSASLVIGQTSLTSAAGCNQGATATASTICNPWGMAFDSSGDLWVSDPYDNRVLEFKPPFSTGMAASLELGQPGFTTTTTNQGGLSATSLYFPYQPAFDSSGNLWISDGNNSRVLEFKPPFSNGMAASLELGQPSGAAAFTSNGAYTSQSGFFSPYGISFDTSGNFQVVDSVNGRVMIFEPPFSNGMNATIVLGQADFTHGAQNQGGNAGANTLKYPIGGLTF